MNRFEELMVKFEGNIYAEKYEVIDWIKEKVELSGAKGVVLGMSGGIDCSVVARLLQEAKIPALLIKMPYGKSMDFAGDKNDADDFIKKFSFKSLTIDITKEVDSVVEKLKNNGIEVSDIARANIMPRIRMTNLYTIAQSLGYIVAGTGNLSEISNGYFTKWGDGASDFNPLANFTKTEVRILAKYLDVPERIIKKAPSANLWENQTDEDEMGITYYDLDRYILTGEGDISVKGKVEKSKRNAAHKTNPVDIFVRKPW